MYIIYLREGDCSLIRGEKPDSAEISLKLLYSLLAVFEQLDLDT